MPMIPLSDHDVGRVATALRAHAAKHLLDMRRVAASPEAQAHEAEADGLVELANRIETTARNQSAPRAPQPVDRAEATA